MIILDMSVAGFHSPSISLQIIMTPFSSSGKSKGKFTTFVLDFGSVTTLVFGPKNVSNVLNFFCVFVNADM